MCDTKFSIYLNSVRFGICACAGGHVSLGFSLVGVFKRVFSMGFFSRRVTSAVSFCFSIHVSVVFVALFNCVSPLIKPFLTLRGWHEEKFVYWNVSVTLKCVWTSSILFDAKRGPLKTSVSKKTARSDDISHVNLIVVWNLLGKINETVDFLFA